MKVLITSGGTKIPIDKVRDITNMSTGTFGTKIAEACLRRGHEVAFFRARYSKSPMQRVFYANAGKYEYENFHTWFCERGKWSDHYREMEFSTFEQYERGLSIFIGCEKPDVIVLAAAVSDYTVEKPFNGKVRSNDMLTLRLTSLPKIINKIKSWAPYAKLVGFKLMVNSMKDDLVAAATKSCVENGCDFVVANDLEDIKEGKHRLNIVYPSGFTSVHDTDPQDPDYLAKTVVHHIEGLMAVAS